MHERRAGIAITVANGTLPNKFGLLAGFGTINQESADPAAVTIVVMNKADAVVSPFNGRAGAESAATCAGRNKTLFQFDQFFGIVSEGRSQHHHFIAERSFSFGNATV